MNAHDPFSHLIGNESVKQYLKVLYKKKTIGNSLLFAGPEGVGKSLFAKSFARMLLAADPIAEAKFDSGNHPDLHVYHPEGKIGMHSIQSMRELTERVYQRPYEAPYKVFIIHDADRMLSYSANALLKTFEEPAEKSILILLSHAPERLLPTVFSRCRTILFHAIQEDLISQWLIHSGKPGDEAKILARLARGSLGKAFRMHEAGGGEMRKSLLRTLSGPKLFMSKQVVHAAAEVAELIEAAKKDLEGEYRSDSVRVPKENLTAAQKEEIEKEVEGAVSLRQASEAHSLFEIVLSWYRDLWLLSTGAHSKFLLNSDYEAALEQAYQRGELQPLEMVQQVIGQAKLGLERSTSLQIVLEGLFLQLKFAESFQSNREDHAR